MDQFTVTATIRVRAASRRAAEEFVESCLAQETALNPALDVMSVTANEEF